MFHNFSQTIVKAWFRRNSEPPNTYQVRCSLLFYMISLHQNYSYHHINHTPVFNFSKNFKQSSEKHIITDEFFIYINKWWYQKERERERVRSIERERDRERKKERKSCMMVRHGLACEFWLFTARPYFYFDHKRDEHLFHLLFNQNWWVEY